MILVRKGVYLKNQNQEFITGDEPRVQEKYINQINIITITDLSQVILLVRKGVYLKNQNQVFITGDSPRTQGRLFEKSESRVHHRP